MVEDTNVILFLSRIKSNGEEGKDIRFTPKGANAFLEDIAPYILPQFSYKLPKYLRNIPKIDISEVYSEYEQPLLETVITKIDNTFKPNVKTKYDIQVEGNHNYFSNNMLVHNSGIQKGVAVSEVDKFFMIFGIKIGNLWLPIEDYHINKPEDRIFHALDFPSFEVTIDLNDPAAIQNTLITFTESVENECPVGKQLGAVDCLIGEGIVWKPKTTPWCDNSDYWFKVKGEKHSSSKVKKLASVDVEKLNSIKDFVDYAVTESRLQQGLTEIGLDMKKMGEFIKWISQDVFKEESDTMKENNLEMKDIGKELSNKARKWYIEQYNSAV